MLPAGAPRNAPRHSRLYAYGDQIEFSPLQIVYWQFSIIVLIKENVIW